VEIMTWRRMGSATIMCKGLNWVTWDLLFVREINVQYVYVFKISNISNNGLDVFFFNSEECTV